MGGGLGEGSVPDFSPAEPADDTAPASQDDLSDVITDAAPAESAADPGDGGEPEESGEQPAAPKPGDYQWLLAQYNELLAKTGAAPAENTEVLDDTPAPQAIPKNVVPGEAPPVDFEISDEEAEAAGFLDGAAATGVLRKAMEATASQTRQWFEKQASLMVLKSMAESFRNLHIGEMFYDKHPEMERYGALVGHTIAQIKNANPALTPRQVMAEVERVVGPIVEKAGGMAQALDATTRGNPPSQKTSGGGGTVRGARVMSTTEQILNRMAETNARAADDPELRRLGIT